MKGVLLPFFFALASFLVGEEGFVETRDRTPLPGTRLLELEGDIASLLVSGVDRFLLEEIEKSVSRRARHWKRDFSSAGSYSKSIEPNR